MIDRLFVYGTLAPGAANAHLLAVVPGTWEAATVKGRRIEGSGPATGYPGLILDGAGDMVSGWLFTSEQLPEHWARLDEFEGPGYERVLTTANCRHGDVNAYVYILSEVGLSKDSD